MHALSPLHIILVQSAISTMHFPSSKHFSSLGMHFVHIVQLTACIFVPIINHIACNHIPKLSYHLSNHSLSGSGATRTATARVQTDNLIVHVVHTRRASCRNALSGCCTHDDLSRRVQQFEQLRSGLHSCR